VIGDSQILLHRTTLIHYIYIGVQQGKITQPWIHVVRLVFNNHLYGITVEGGGKMNQ